VHTEFTSLPRQRGNILGEKIGTIGERT